mgnify:CR=1 FL=1
MREIVRGLSLILAQGVIEEGAEGFGAKLRDLAQTLKLLTGRRTFRGIGRKNLERSEIILVGIVGRLGSHRGREMTLFLGDIALGAGKPPGDDMIGRAFAVFRRNAPQGRPGDIQLPKA